MYGKIFKQIYKGTLAMVGPWEALVTFQQMIILADKDGVVDMTPDALSRETTIPLKIIAKGLEALSKPDPESRTPDEDGRRIVLLAKDRSWGWRIVNYEHYRKLRSEEERRAYHRKYYREKRSKSATKGRSSVTQQHSTNSTNSSKQYVVSSKQKREGASRFPPKDFKPSHDGHNWAIAQGFTKAEVRLETEKFMDYERPRPLKAWDRAWRNWMRKAKSWKKDNREDKKTTEAEANRLGLIRTDVETDDQWNGRVRDALVMEQYG